MIHGIAQARQRLGEPWRGWVQIVDEARAMKSARVTYIRTVRMYEYAIITLGGRCDKKSYPGMLYQYLSR